jgi:HK97 family phage portal protein
MKLFGYEFVARKVDSGTAAMSIDQFMRRLEAVYMTAAAITVTPENCMQSPTVHAIVTTVTRRISALSLQVLQKTTSDGRTAKQPLPNHPVTRLLNAPNDIETKTNYWQDAVSRYLRHGKHFAYKARGVTGPIRRLEPLHPDAVDILQDSTGTIQYRVTTAQGQRVYNTNEVHYVRGPARDGVTGDSPVMDCREAIALEIAAERFGGSFFAGGAMPGVIFKYKDGIQGFKTKEEETKFIDGFQAAYGKLGRFRAMLMPKGIEKDDSIGIENDKAQFLETRKHQRNVIAGAFGMPPYLVGDLERQTFNNAEQQSIAFVTDVVLPICRTFEDAMEWDLLTAADRIAGIIIRFNIDASLRGDFMTRQGGLNIMRQAGVINANDWREAENMNPISEQDGGDEYWRRGPSGQSAQPPNKPGASDTEPPPAKPNGRINP